MKKPSNGLCSISERNLLKDSIFDAVDEWLNYCDADPATGLAIEPGTLSVDLCDRDAAKSREWIPMETLAPHGEADADAVLDLADRICFVR